MIPKYAGRLLGGAIKATRMNAPEATPAAPTPAMARPMIKAVLVGATPVLGIQYSIGVMKFETHVPHIRLPNSKIKIAARYVHFKVKYLNSLPQGAVNEATVKKKADPYHPIWETL